MFFDDIQGILRVLLVGPLAYAAVVLALRVSGKRSLAKLNAFDLVVTVALGSALATVLLSNNISFVEGALAFAVLLLLQWIAARGSVASRRFARLVRSRPRLLVDSGRFLYEEMEAERVTQEEVEQAIRSEGIGRLSKVAAVVLESDGSMSVIPSGSEGELTALSTTGS